MNSISTILWDIGGVVLTNAWDRQQREAVLTHFGLDPAAFEPRHFEVFEALERGEISIDDYLRHAVFFEARSFSQAEFLDAMRAESQLLPDSGLGILRRLAASEEYVLATVNNESRAMNDYRLAHFGLLDLFDAFFSSCYLGLRKPNPKIYSIALDVLQRHADEAVFIDDRAENVAAAASLGIHPIRYQSAAQLAAELAKLGAGETENVLGRIS